MISLATETEGTLFSDCLLLDLGSGLGFRPLSTSIQFPRKSFKFKGASRKPTLRGVDGNCLRRRFRGSNGRKRRSARESEVDFERARLRHPQDFLRAATEQAGSANILPDDLLSTEVRKRMSRLSRFSPSRELAFSRR